jgi:hypothetical protein
MVLLIQNNFVLLQVKNKYKSITKDEKYRSKKILKRSIPAGERLF